jgi:hypothetical protein
MSSTFQFDYIVRAYQPFPDGSDMMHNRWCGEAVFVRLVNPFPLTPITSKFTIVLFAPSCLTLTPRPPHLPISS